jgi:hypothetical protein
MATVNVPGDVKVVLHHSIALSPPSKFVGDLPTVGWAER